jgi:Tol biopolymer transport system component
MRKSLTGSWPAAAVALAAVTATTLVTGVAHGEATVDRVSVGTGGAEANNISDHGIPSADGRFVAFLSLASNLSPLDTNLNSDVYVRDRVLGTTELITVDVNGAPSGGTLDDVSADGRFVVFTSHGTSVVANDFNGVGDVFIRDRVAGTTQRVSVDSDETQAADRSLAGSVSRDGRYVAFTTYAPLSDADRDSDSLDVYVRDLIAGTTELVSIGRDGFEAGGQRPSISDNGRFVAFLSGSKRLVKRDTNRKHDVFVRDLTRDRTRRVSVTSKGDEASKRSFGPQMAGFGRYVLFTTAAKLSRRDTNAKLDVYVHDRRKDKTELVSVDSGERQAGGPVITPSISADGRFVSFNAAADLRDGGRTTDALYLRDRTAGTTDLLVKKVGDGAVLSGNAKVVVFDAFRHNVVTPDTNGLRDMFALVR